MPEFGKIQSQNRVFIFWENCYENTVSVLFKVGNNKSKYDLVAEHKESFPDCPDWLVTLFLTAIIVILFNPLLIRSDCRHKSLINPQSCSNELCCTWVLFDHAFYLSVVVSITSAKAFLILEKVGNSYWHFEKSIFVTFFTKTDER